MHILMSGGTGFVGKSLTKALVQKGYTVSIATRSPEEYVAVQNISYISYDVLHALPRVDVVINLAGESLFGYWTEEKKAAILTSRMETTQTLIDFMEQAQHRPTTFISGSAVGFYGTSDHKIFTEETTTHGDDFLAKVASSWEEHAKQAENRGIRTVYMRFGVILGNGGAFPLMQLPVKSFVGGKVGHGAQWVSWVHLTDVVQIIIAATENKHIQGPVNVTAPHPVRNDHLMKAIAASLRRPYWLPAPAWGMRMILGEMSTLLTEGQYVIPDKMTRLNSISFKYPTIEQALQHLLE